MSPYPSAFRSVSIRVARSSICSRETGSFSQARLIPLTILSRPNVSLLPSFFITRRGRFSSIFSYVVNRVEHSGHSLLRRTTRPSSAVLVSITRVSKAPHDGHRTDTPPIYSNHRAILLLYGVSFQRDVVLLSYGTLRRTAKHNKKSRVSPAFLGLKQLCCNGHSTRV